MVFATLAIRRDLVFCKSVCCAHALRAKPAQLAQYIFNNNRYLFCRGELTRDVETGFSSEAILLFNRGYAKILITNNIEHFGGKYELGTVDGLLSAQRGLR